MPTAIPGIKRWPQPPGYWSSLDICRRGKWLMFGNTRCATAFVDLDSWPPHAAANRSEYVASFDVLPDGRVVVCSMPTQPEGDYAVRIHSPDWPTDPAARPTEVYPLPGGLTLSEVWAVADQVLTFGSLIAKYHPPAARRAYRLDDGEFVPAPGLPPVRTFDPGPSGHQVHVNGKVTLCTGEEILIWDGDGYSWGGKRFKLSWELGARLDGIDGWTSVPWGQGGFFYQSNWKLMYARRGKRPVRVCPDAEQVFFLSPGPEDSVIFCQGKNPKRHVARVWFPAEGAYIPLVRGDLGLSPSATPDNIYWSEATRHAHIEPLTTLPDSELLALKRTRPRGKGYLVPKG